MKVHTALFTAMAVCIVFSACTAEDSVDEPTTDEKKLLLQGAAEEAEVALLGYFECEEEAVDCSTEEEELVDALEHYESIEGRNDNDFRAAAIATCTGKQPVSCSAPGSCTATDDVGCVCFTNGALSVAKSCAQSPPPPPPPPDTCGPCAWGYDCHCGENWCTPIGVMCP